MSPTRLPLLDVSDAPAAPSRPPVRAVIFDCDGTLVDSEGPALATLHALACEEGAAISLADADRLFRGVRMLDCARWVAAQRPDRPEGFETGFIRRVRLASEARFRQGMAPIAGAPELLALLARLALPVAVATNGPRDKVELTLALTGLRAAFGEHVYCAYEVGMFKPEPGLFLHAAQALGVEPAYCMVIEDSLPGVRAGLAAGMQVLALMAADDLPAGLATQVRRLDHLAEAGAWLQAGPAASG
ncbi:MAG: hypothetical protein RLZZ584_3106 [Pseudomonadota bacterium]